MSISIRKAQGINIVRPMSPTLQFKTDTENLHPELASLRYELHAERQRNQQLEYQLQCEAQLRMSNEQLLISDYNTLAHQNEEWKLRCQELEMKLRENSIANQDNIRDATSRFTLLSIEVERLNQLSTRRLQENDFLQRQMEQQGLTQELIQIQKLVEELKQELQNKQKIIYSLQEQLQAKYKFTSFRETDQNYTKPDHQKPQIDNLYQELAQINNFNRQLNEENRTMKQQVESCYREIDRLNRILMQRNQEITDLFSKQQPDQEYIMTLQSELQVAQQSDWRRNFSELNEKYHKIQEQLCLAQAELEAAKATSKRF